MRSEFCPVAFPVNTFLHVDITESSHLKCNLMYSDATMSTNAFKSQFAVFIWVSYLTGKKKCVLNQPGTFKWLRKPTKLSMTGFQNFAKKPISNCETLGAYLLKALVYSARTSQKKLSQQTWVCFNALVVKSQPCYMHSMVWNLDAQWY